MVAKFIQHTQTMVKTILPFLAAFLMLACSGSAIVKNKPLITTEQLLAGTLIFGPEAANLSLPDVDILKLDDDMREFVKAAVPQQGSLNYRSKRLISALLARGLLDLDYDASKTYTAAETFHARAGNCLAFTNLFVALAREAGIAVKYQQVEVPPIWSQKGEFIVLNNHINVKLESPLGPNYEVDFNQVDVKGNFKTWLISDAAAFSQFYNNLAVSYLQKTDYRNAYRYLKKAILLEPRLSDHWTNLGVLYSQQKHYHYAEAAYLHAIGIDHRAKLASSNLAKLYQHLGEVEKAKYYQAKVWQFKNSNPYYHYWLAKKSFNDKKYQASIDSLKRAIQRKNDEHLFYFLLGSNYLKLGQKLKAEYFFDKAMQYANNKTQERYLSKIERLIEASDEYKSLL